MKTTTHILVLFLGIMGLSFHGVMGQTGDLQRAEQEFLLLNYQRAIHYYNEAPDKGLRDYRNLARCYLVLGDLEKARQCLEKICKSEQRKPEDIWNLAQVLMQDSLYEAAWVKMQEFYVANPRDSRTIRYKNAGDYRAYLLRNQENYTLSYLPFNTIEDDFGVSLLGNRMIFASSRGKYNPIVRKWNGNGRNFLGLYAVNPRLNEDPVPFGKTFKGKYHTGPLAFSQEGKLCVITRTQQETTDKHERQHLGLYFLEKTNEGWSEPIPFPYNGTNFSTCHGALNQAGTVLYFSSNRPGRKGGMDLWVSEKQDSTWGEPRPLHELNTEGDEVFPFILESGVLLFASDGHVGLGGLDIFAAKKQGGRFVKTMNLGYPLNSSSDDFGLILNEELAEGYFSTNRYASSKIHPEWVKRDSLAPNKDDDIYKVNLKTPLEFGKSIQGRATDRKGKPLSGVNVELSGLRGDYISTVQTSTDGTFEFVVYDIGTYKLTGTKRFYFEDETTVSIRSRNEDAEASLRLKRDPSISLNLVIIDSETGLPLEGVEVNIWNKLENTHEHLLTTPGWDYAKRLPEKRMGDSLSYQFVLKKQDYLIKTIYFNTRIDQPGVYEVHKFEVNDRFLDFSMKKKTLGDDLAQQLGILPYFYKMDKTVIEPEFTSDLEVIIQSLKDNPGLHIQIRNHTDCRGQSGLNMTLSEKRARAITQYITARLPGAEDRVTYKGLGESRPKAECSCDAYRGSNCSDNDYQVDRRTEFIITKI